MRPDWKIFADLANAMNCHTMNYKTPQDVFKEIRKVVPSFPAADNRRPRRMTPISAPEWKGAGVKNAPRGDFVLVAKPGGYRHRGVDISSKVGGLKELALEEGFRMNPEDLEALGLRSGDTVSLSCDGGKISADGTVKADEECPRGAVYFTRPVVFGGLENRRGILPLCRLGGNPAHVDVSRHAV
jgi:predicted molibdopterin-dependent oxidoreductase YjgC